MRILIFCVVLIPSLTYAQVNIDAYKNYFLVGPFGEVCTMCEVVILCEAGDTVPEYTTIPATGTFTLYYLQTRSFWSQIATIWEWFIVNFTSDALAARGHTRPVCVYEISDGKWSGQETIDGRLMLDPGVIELGESNIDRVDRQWSGDGKAQGYCTRMPLWESIEVIKNNTPGDTA